MSVISIQGDRLPRPSTIQIDLDLVYQEYTVECPYQRRECAALSDAVVHVDKGLKTLMPNIISACTVRLKNQRCQGGINLRPL